MAESKRTQVTINQERALLVSVILPDSDVDIHDPLGELRSLVKTAGALVVDEMVAKRSNVSPAMYVGRGKAEEIAARAEMNRANAVIFDNDLSPAQIRELETVTNRKVLDRSEVILDIFAATARTNEANLQVELAQLEYTYPRLTRMWSHLERVAGGATSAAAAVGGIGSRGPGEKQLEIDRRLVKRRVMDLKKRIADVDARKQRLIGARNEYFRACLVGYTNAGKSTMMNLLTGAGVLVADRLFSTLDTRTRRWKLGGGEYALLSDTVGFIRNLPHHLVASFRATLEEAISADLLLHVADASHPRVRQQIRSVQDVLAELGCEQREQVLLLNKIDSIIDPVDLTILRREFPGAFFVSAATGQGAGEVLEAVRQRVVGRSVNVQVEADCTNGPLMNFLERLAGSAPREFTDARVRLSLTLGEKQVEALRKHGADVAVVP